MSDDVPSWNSVPIHCWEHSEGPQPKNTALSVLGIFLMQFPSLLKFTFFPFLEILSQASPDQGGESSGSAFSGLTPYFSLTAWLPFLKLPAFHGAGRRAASSHSPSRHVLKSPRCPGQSQQLWSFLTGWFPFFQ